MKFFSELFSWIRIFILMLFQKNFYLYLWSVIKDVKNMYYRYKV
jgi:hypothetical protein